LSLFPGASRGIFQENQIMGYWSRGSRRREPTQLGIAEKKINGIGVGFVLGFVEGNTWLRNVRKSVIFKTREEAETALACFEDNTQRFDSVKFKVKKTGVSF
jgi:hypothetical protein